MPAPKPVKLPKPESFDDLMRRVVKIKPEKPTKSKLTGKKPVK